MHETVCFLWCNLFKFALMVYLHGSSCTVIMVLAVICFVNRRSIISKIDILCRPAFPHAPSDETNNCFCVLSNSFSVCLWLQKGQSCPPTLFFLHTYSLSVARKKYRKLLIFFLPLDILAFAIDSASAAKLLFFSSFSSFRLCNMLDANCMCYNVARMKCFIRY